MQISRVAAIHDITGVGRCGLSVAVPVLSALGHQVCPLPTAVLSTHPNRFERPYMRALGEDTVPILAHWAGEGLRFDAVYTGFMSGAEQIRAVAAGLARMRLSNGVVLVDPVLGDHGRLYGIVDDSMIDAMCMLAERADVITPNLTEAYVLLGREYADKPCSREEAAALAADLSAKYRTVCVVKGVPYEKGRRMNVMCEPQSGQTAFVEYDMVPSNYPGTGDVFASLLLGVFLHTTDMREAFRAASRVTLNLVAHTYSQRTSPREGVLVEAFCPRMMEKCGLA